MSGMLKSMTLSSGVRKSEGCQNALDAIASEIRSFAAPLEEIMEKFESMPEYKELLVFGLCKKNFLKNRSFQSAWEKALEQAKPTLSLNDGDREVLVWFGRSLGTTDADGQAANCARYGELLAQRLVNAREDTVKRGRMYTSLGVLAGVFCVTLLF